MSFAEQLAADAQATAVTITDIFAQQETPATRLEQAMLYATMNGGKRLRAALVLGAAGEMARRALRSVFGACCGFLLWCWCLLGLCLGLFPGPFFPLGLFLFP